MLPRHLALYVDALRAATPRQLAARPRRLLSPAALALGQRDLEPPAWTPAARGAGVPEAPQSGPEPQPHECGRFHGIGRSRPFEDSRRFWTDRSDGVLFLFALHGFGSLARYAAGPPSPGGDAFWTEVLSSWLRHWGAVPRNPAWHPYPTTERLITWSAALSRGGWPPQLAAELRRATYRQARYMARAIEHDIGGNHVLFNAAAVLVAGVCSGDSRLQARGLRVLEAELRRQLLADGGHVERSPSYHRAVLSWVRDAIGVLDRAGAAQPVALQRARERMEDWLRALAGPDGSLPLLNDAWQGPPIAPGSRPLDDLPATGYITLRHGGDQVLFDVAPLAPDHLPPHAHADALSFVLWGDGRPLVADPGAGDYAGGVRDAFRATRAHATVEVDGEDQCVFWRPFRASRLPRVRRLTVRPLPGGGVLVSGEHDGYTRLPDPVVHRRTITWLPGEGLIVADRLRSRRAHRVVTSLPLAPGVVYEGGRIGPFTLLPLAVPGEVRVEPAQYAPYLGTYEPTRVVRSEGTVTPGHTFGWALLRGGAAVHDLDGRLEIELAGGRRVLVESV